MGDRGRGRVLGALRFGLACQDRVGSRSAQLRNGWLGCTVRHRIPCRPGQRIRRAYRVGHCRCHDLVRTDQRSTRSKRGPRSAFLLCLHPVYDRAPRHRGDWRRLQRLRLPRGVVLVGLCAHRDGAGSKGAHGVVPVPDHGQLGCHVHCDWYRSVVRDDRDAQHGGPGGAHSRGREQSHDSGGVHLPDGGHHAEAGVVSAALVAAKRVHVRPPRPLRRSSPRP